jgi:hypothetical protein
MSNREPIPLSGRFGLVALSCFLAWFFGALFTRWMVSFVDQPKLMAFLGPLLLMGLLLLYLYIRLFLAMAMDTCLDCLNPWCKGAEADELCERTSK